MIRALKPCVMDMSDKFPGSQLDGKDKASQRAKSRDSLFLLGKLTFEGLSKSFDVRIRNLSATGMMAECPAPVSVGQLVVVETKGISEIHGRVAWATDGRIGIAFAVEIDPQLARNPAKAGAPEVMIPDYLKNATAQRPGFRRP